jgi:hypothetical protein
LETIAAAAKMSWAAERNTTRSEDLAYCLLGLFDVNMPLLYGEGQEKAFIRLQEEILKTSDDESIFAWRASPEEVSKKPYWCLLAPTPAYFKDCGDFARPRFVSSREGQPTIITNRGIRVELSLAPLRGDQSGTIFLAILECFNEAGDCLVTIFMQKLSNLEAQYAKIAPEVLPDVIMGLFEPPLRSFTQSFRPDIEQRSLILKRISEPEPRYLFVKLILK